MSDNSSKKAAPAAAAASSADAFPVKRKVQLRIRSKILRPYARYIHIPLPKEWAGKDVTVLLKMKAQSYDASHCEARFPFPLDDLAGTVVEVELVEEEEEREEKEKK